MRVAQATVKWAMPGGSMRNDFDKDFRFFKVVWVGVAVVSVSMMVFLGWVIIKVLQHFKIV
jgi:hypothetical protein